MASRIAPELPFKLELPLRDVDGNLRWFEANAAPTYDADGQLLRWVCVARTSTAAGVRKCSDWRARPLLACCWIRPTKASTHRPQRRRYAVQRRLLKILGFASREEVLGRHLHHVIHHSRPDGSPYPVQGVRSSIRRSPVSRGMWNTSCSSASMAAACPSNTGSHRSSVTANCRGDLHLQRHQRAHPAPSPAGVPAGTERLPAGQQRTGGPLLRTG